MIILDLKEMGEKSELKNLLLLNGEIFPMNNGYWTKIEAWETKGSENIPHGIRYSLTLHDRNNNRILGYDNAHAFKEKHGRFSADKTTWDHIHRRNRVITYEFESAYQLLEDFWNEVEKIIKES